MLNGCTLKCVRLSRPSVTALSFHFISFRLLESFHILTFDIQAHRHGAMKQQILILNGGCYRRYHVRQKP